MCGGDRGITLVRKNVLAVQVIALSIKACPTIPQEQKSLPRHRIFFIVLYVTRKRARLEAVIRLYCISFVIFIRLPPPPPRVLVMAGVIITIGIKNAFGVASNARQSWELIFFILSNCFARVGDNNENSIR